MMKTFVVVSTLNTNSFIQDQHIVCCPFYCQILPHSISNIYPPHEIPIYDLLKLPEMILLIYYPNSLSSIILYRSDIPVGLPT